MNTLALCQPKIDHLHSSAKGDRKVMVHSTYFHSFVEKKCREIMSPHNICNYSWKYRLLQLIYVLNSNIAGEKYNQKVLEYAWFYSGLHAYTLMEDDQALKYLNITLQYMILSGSGCKELYISITYMTLYAIHSRQGDLQGMKDTLVGIHDTIDLHNFELLCDKHVFIYRDIIAPFLQQVGETELANKLRDVDSYIHCYYCACNCFIQEGHWKSIVELLNMYPTTSLFYLS
jgi:hypothetical protein